MSHRPLNIPYRSIAQSILYLSAGACTVVALMMVAAFTGWATGWQAVLLFLPVLETSFMAWSFSLFVTLIVLGLAVYALTLPWLPQNRPDSVLIRSKKGEVTIPLTTIEEYLQREAVRIPGVNHLRLRTTTLDGLLVFHIEAFVTDQVSIPGITGELQEFVEKESQEVIGLDRIGPVHVMIKRICGDTRPVPLPMLAHQAGREAVRRSQTGIS